MPGQGDRDRSPTADLFFDQLWPSHSRVEVLLRGHLWVEFFFDSMLITAMKRPSEIDLDRTTWRYKLAWCGALGLVPADKAQGLAALNRLRNDLSHDLATELSDDTLAALLSSGPKPWREAAEASYDPSNPGTHPGGITSHDYPLAKLQAWFLVVLMDLEHTSAMQEYERTNEADLLAAAVVQRAHEKNGRMMTWEQAAEHVGLAAPPQFGDWIREDSTR